MGLTIEVIAGLLLLALTTGLMGKHHAERSGRNPRIGFAVGFFGSFIGVLLIKMFDDMLKRRRS